MWSVGSEEETLQELPVLFSLLVSQSNINDKIQTSLHNAYIPAATAWKRQDRWGLSLVKDACSVWPAVASQLCSMNPAKTSEPPITRQVCHVVFTTNWEHWKWCSLSLASAFIPDQAVFAFSWHWHYIRLIHTTAKWAKQQQQYEKIKKNLILHFKTY